MNLLPILIISDLQIKLPLDGLAKRKPLPSLSEKRVTAKVRESLKQKFNYKHVKVACKTQLKKGQWKGRGYYKGKKFNWIVK